MKRQLIEAGFAVLGATRLHKPLARWARGRGAILMLHRVCPWRATNFAPNRLLEIEPTFLDAALTRIEALGFDLVSLDDALVRLDEQKSRPFVALTFDDGYLDTETEALPILARHAAPFTLFVTTGFAERTARLWWVELEEAIRKLARIELTIADRKVIFPSRNDAEKMRAFKILYRMLRAGPEQQLRDSVAGLAKAAGIEETSIAARLCLDWDGIARLARHPLCTIGAHTLTHPMLAKHSADVVRRELAESRRIIETRLGLPVRHLAYPVGDAASAGPREHAVAAELGFASAVTTRPGMIFPEHRVRRTALPRLSLNGHWQSLEALEMLLSGVPFALWNAGRRVVA